MRRVLGAMLVAALAATAPLASAQEAAPVLSPIMVIDFDRVFNVTAYGQRITRELNAERQRVQDENDRLAEELVAEEAALTESRATMDPEDFRAAAEAFGERAQSIRASREAEQARLVSLRDAERQQFLERIEPIVAEMMARRGAVVAMDRRAVLQAIGSANATEDVIAMIDSVLGDGRLDPNEAPTARPTTDLSAPN